MEATEAARHSTDRIGEQGIWKLLFEFAIPAVVMMLFSSLYNIVDSVFLGQAVGTNGIAVATLAMPIMTLFMGLSALSGVGGNSIAAIALGAGEHERLERTLGNTATLLLITGLLEVAAMWLFCDQVLDLVGTTPELYEQARLFILILATGYPIQCVGLGLNNFLRTAGKPNLALATNVAGTTVCIGFNYLLVMVMGFGVAGSATATLIGQFVTLVPTVGYLVYGKSSPFHLHACMMRPQLRLMRDILALGLASFAMQAAVSVVNVLLNQALVTYGTADPVGAAGALSTIGVAGRVNGFAIMPVVGVTMGAQTLIGYNYGARKWARVRKSFGAAVVLCTVIICSFFALIHLIPNQIANLFGVTGDLEAFTVYALQMMNMLFPLVGFQIQGSNYFQATGQPAKATVLGLTRQVLFFIPLIFLLPRFLPMYFPFSPLQSVILVYPFADTLSVTLIACFVFAEMRRLRSLEVTSTLVPEQAGV